MNSTTQTNTPKWFLIVAGLALIWNLMGVAAYLSQMTMDLDILPEAEQQFYATIPAWATAAFAIAVFAGSVGSVGLLLKKAWAIPVLVASFLGVVAQVTHSLLIGNGIEVFGMSALIFPSLTLAIGAALIGFAVVSKKHSWII